VADLTLGTPVGLGGVSLTLTEVEPAKRAGETIRRSAYRFTFASGSIYHANIKTFGWTRYFIQTPELHSIHHQFDHHRHNFSDLPIWDRLFGTYQDTTDFADRCGFHTGAEAKLGQMLIFKDVYRD
jgi:hypothetical protein